MSRIGERHRGRPRRGLTSGALQPTQVGICLDPDVWVLLPWQALTGGYSLSISPSKLKTYGDAWLTRQAVLHTLQALCRSPGCVG